MDQRRESASEGNEGASERANKRAIARCNPSDRRSGRTPRRAMRPPANAMTRTYGNEYKRNK